MGLYHNTLAHDIGPVDPDAPGGVRVIHSGAVYEATGDIEKQVAAINGQVKLTEAEAAEIASSRSPAEGDPVGEQELRRRGVIERFRASRSAGPGTITTAEAVAHPGDLSKLKVGELRKLAVERGVTVARGDGKDGDPVRSDYEKALA